MQLTLNIENETIAQKILWLLEHFENEGLQIENQSDIKNKIQTPEYSEEYIEKHWRELAYNASGNPDQDDDKILIDSYGKYLNDKHTI